MKLGGHTLSGGEFDHNNCRVVSAIIRIEHKMDDVILQRTNGRALKVAVLGKMAIKDSLHLSLAHTWPNFRNRANRGFNRAKLKERQGKNEKNIDRRQRQKRLVFAEGECRYAENNAEQNKDNFEDGVAALTSPIINTNRENCEQQQSATTGDCDELFHGTYKLRSGHGKTLVSSFSAAKPLHQRCCQPAPVC